MFFILNSFCFASLTMPLLSFHCFMSSFFNVQLVVTYPEFCHRNSQGYGLDYFNIFFKFEIFITDFHEVCLWTVVIQCFCLPDFFVVFLMSISKTCAFVPCALVPVLSCPCFRAETRALLVSLSNYSRTY